MLSQGRDKSRLRPPAVAGTFYPLDADELDKLVASAMANARVTADKTNEFLDDQDLFISNAYVDEGTTLKRFRPRAQGRAFQIKKRTSHITVELSTPVVPADAATGTQTKKASK